MRIWTKALGLAGGGAVLGTLLGAAMQPTMKPPPQPLWHGNAASGTGPEYAIVEAGPVDLVSPNWYDGPVDLSVPRYQPYGGVMASSYAAAELTADPLPGEESLPSDEPAEPAIVVAAVSAQAAADDARAAQAAAATVPPVADPQPALTDGDPPATT